MIGQSIANERFTLEPSVRGTSIGASRTLERFTPAGAPKFDEWEEYVLLIDPRTLGRECLSKNLTECDGKLRIMTVGSLEEWLALKMQASPSAILLMIGGHKASDAGISTTLRGLVERFQTSPVIVGADSDELVELLHALECGARGYIPTNVGIKVAAEAIALARAGGVFVPASSLIGAKEALAPLGNQSNGLDSLFTPRETMVAEALRRGKANKIIAYEMGLCESTVKVHIRNIMSKLSATSRTEVAYKIRELVR